MTHFWNSQKVRKTFIDFFCVDNAHTFYPSSSVVPHNDPTLLFTNAGMNQYKPIFLGQADPLSPLAALKSAANSQKCIRAGGKHNDLDDVGKDSYHHTFFEMLGNWSFNGCYGKRGAIGLAWKLLTEVYGLDKTRLYVTYFGGDAKKCPGVPVDEETKQIWIEMGLPKESVLPFGGKENFWEMGETGPCGPCTEIHYDKRSPAERAAALAAGNKWVEGREMVNSDTPEVIEIWNNVFISYNRDETKTLTALPNMHVDTGMGFERICAALQDKPSNYDTDVFTPIFDEIAKYAGENDDSVDAAAKTDKYTYRGRFGKEDAQKLDTSYRVVADHIRTSTIAISDGCIPDVSGRGYVLRRIIRRAVRYAQQFLKTKPGFFSKLVDVTVKSFEVIFPETRINQAHIEKVIAKEESKFEKTLQKGIKYFQEKVADMEKAQLPKVIDGEFAFRLYDTHGFPVDLTQIMAEEIGYTVDIPAFLKERSKAVEISKQKTKKTELNAIVLKSKETDELINKLKVPLTNDDAKYTWADISSNIVAIFDNATQNFVSKYEKKFSGDVNSDNVEVGLLVKETNFYAESGGQITDLGEIQFPKSSNLKFNVLYVRSYAGYIVHNGYFEEKEPKQGTVSISVGETVDMKPNFHRRKNVAANHTATHMLNFSLRTEVGKPYGGQSGSFVDEERFRFDYSTKSVPTAEMLANVEKKVNQLIAADLTVNVKIHNLDEAKKISGICHMFDEHYPDPVRIVSVGLKLDESVLANPAEPKWADYSMEFCGGTHLQHTGEASCFVLISDQSISEGKRRITAFTKKNAKNIIEIAESFQKRVDACERLYENESKHKEFITQVRDLTAELDTLTLSVGFKSQMRERLAGLTKLVKLIEKKEEKRVSEKAAAYGNELAQKIISNQDKFVVLHLNDEDLSTQLRASMQTIIDIVIAQAKIPILMSGIEIQKGGEKRLLFIADVPKAMTSKLSAGEWVNLACQTCGGKGGGKPDHAQGQGVDVSAHEAAMEKVKQLAVQKMN